MSVAIYGDADINCEIYDKMQAHKQYGVGDEKCK
jgi:hypothetical protein